ncbi:Replication protein A 70 kDa DNA-binding subunit B, partial [Bienertia sinuspersici]
ICYRFKIWVKLRYASRKNAPNDVTDQTRNFTTTAMLVRKHPVKKSRSGTNNLQQLVFENRERFQMKGVLFDRDIDLFHETLVEGKEYDIINPIIARIPEMFKRTEQVYQMTINAATQISETQSAVELPSLPYTLTKVGDYIGKNERIDIIGIAVHMHDKAIVRAKSSGIPYEVRKVEMLDTEMQVIQLSIWNTLVTTEAEQIAQIIDTLPILEVSRVTATTYNGASFNTSFASTIKINPDSPTAQLLHDWKKSHVTAIQQIKNKFIGDRRKLTAITTVCLVQQLSEQQSGTTAWITGKIKDITNKNSLIYNACNVCNKRCEASTGLPFTCHAFSTPHSATLNLGV